MAFENPFQKRHYSVVSKNMNTSEVVINVSFRQGSNDNPIERNRVGIFLNTIDNIVKAGISCVVLYVDTEDSLVSRIADKGITIREHATKGYGNNRREAMRFAAETFPNSQYLCCIEPEKTDMVRFVLPMLTYLQKNNFKLGLFNRTDMESYPEDQKYYYLYLRSAISSLLKFDLDYAFGPVVFHRDVLPYFLEYKSEHGDLWDSILAPRLRIIKDGHPYGIMDIDFQNDPRMTEVESAHSDMIRKRFDQVNNVGPSALRELL